MYPWYIQKNTDTIINPYAYPNVDKKIKDLLEMDSQGFRSDASRSKVQSLISSIIDEEVKKYDCNKKENEENKGKKESE